MWVRNSGMFPLSLFTFAGNRFPDNYNCRLGSLDFHHSVFYPNHRYFCPTVETAPAIASIFIIVSGEITWAEFHEGVCWIESRKAVDHEAPSLE